MVEVFVLYAVLVGKPPEPKDQYVSLALCKRHVVEDYPPEGAYCVKRVIGIPSKD